MADTLGVYLSRSISRRSDDDGTSVSEGCVRRRNGEESQSDHVGCLKVYLSDVTGDKCTVGVKMMSEDER